MYFLKILGSVSVAFVTLRLLRHEDFLNLGSMPTEGLDLISPQFTQGLGTQILVVSVSIYVAHLIFRKRDK